MAEKMPVRILIITGNHLRHRFFSNFLAERCEIAGIISEAKRTLPKTGESEADELTRSHLEERDRAEEKYFENHGAFNAPSENILALNHGEASSPEVFAWIQERNPDSILLFGTSIIRDPLLSAYNGRIINLHLGLSPYYRGSGTNFWPLVLKEPECVGATIHLAVAKVDAGPILLQGHPEISSEDGPHDIGCKAIMAGAELMAQALRRYLSEGLEPQEQRLGGRLFKNKDFFPETILALRRNFSEGMIPKYLAEKSERDGSYPIIG